MLAIIIALIINALVIFLASYIVPGVKLNSFWVAVFIAVILGVVNAFTHHLLVLLGVPPNIVTYGLFTLVVVTLAVMAISFCLPSFEVESFGWALIFSFVVAIINALLHYLLRG